MTWLSNRHYHLGALVLAGSVFLSSSALAALPASAQKQLNGAVFNYNRGFVQKAIPAFQRLSKNYPQDVVPKLWLAKAYIKQGGEQNFDQARNLLREVTTKSPQQGEAWALLGEVTRWDNSTRWESIQALQTALGMADEFEAVKSNQANLTRYLVEQLTWEGKYDEALPYAQSVHGQLEKDRSWLVTYANVLSHTGQANTAVTLFDEAVRPTDSDPLQWRLDFLTALRLSGQQEAAKRYYNQIEPIALEKTDPQVLSSLASAAYELGLYQRAVMVDEWLPADWQNRKDVALRQARALAKLDRAPEAINQFQSVYQQNQMTPWEKLEYGDYLLGLRLPANALPQQNLMETLYQQALADKPELESQVNLRLARVYKRNGQYFMKATEAYQTALGSAEGNARQQILPELLSFVQSNQTNPQAAEQVFEELMYQYSDDTNVKSAYAEFLSWQPAKRKQSVGLYSQLWQSDKQYSDQWQAKLTEVLSWHTPNAGWLKVYDGILAKKPDQQLEKQALISKAKALSGNPDTYPDAVKIISDLKDQYPDDADVTKEWLNVLMVTDPDNRQLAGELKTLVADNPDDIESKLALGRILSQRAQHRQAVKVFNDVLDTQPDNVDALVGKGYALLWGGKQFKAKKLLENVYADYPENPAVAMALASAYKQIGRNDKAIELLKKIRPLLNLNFQDSTQLELKYDFEPVVNYQSLSWQPCADFKAESQAKPPVMFYDFNNPGVVKNDNKSENLSPYIAPEPEELNSNAMVIPASGEITDAQRRQLIEEV